MSFVVLGVVAVLCGSALGVVALDRRVRAEIDLLDSVAVELRLLRGALDRLRVATRATRGAHARIIGSGLPHTGRQ